MAHDIHSNDLPSHETRRVISAEEARQGARPQGVIYVLGVSLVLVAVAFAIIYFW